MSELHKFLFEGLPVRGIVVRITDAWTEILRRRAANTQTGAYPVPVTEMLGEMLAAATLMQSNIKFDGALVMQIMGDGPVKLTVAEIKPDLSLRATATITGDVAPDAGLGAMVNVGNGGRCAITLDPRERLPGQQPYQGVVPLFDDRGEPLDKLSDVLQHYMLQSEQLDTTLVLAANDTVAAGLLIQRLPLQGAGNLDAEGRRLDEDQIGRSEDYNRIATLASSLTREELLSLDVDAILHRLFWQEDVLRFAPQPTDPRPHFACSCSREKVGAMIVGLGEEEAASILAERADIEVGCEFCGMQYRFDAIDAAQLFRPASQTPGSSSSAH
ncbi:MAG: Hsp33 family molecular chaperone HslO [Burkholderiaceae bacterium]|nr:Hsp33 family molecular chaperone HslO [Rhodoferax sp.]MCP5260806.1 Hsp33 family molecular chaperone HslO [Rhodoferax sp.]